MVESISKVQQLLAESKFVEAQKESELALIQHEHSVTAELLELYFESLSSQSKPLPPEMLLNLVEKLLTNKPDEAHKWLSLVDERLKNSQRVLLLQIRLAGLKGKTEDLYHFISEYQLKRFESRAPSIPEIVSISINKFFPNDFHLQLQRLALDLMRMDLVTCENLIKDLILSCFERSSPKGTREKLNALYEVLLTSESLYHLEVYKNLCYFLANGLANKKDYKKIVELVIYLEDFKFQVLVLNLLMKLNHSEIAKDYAAEIRNNKDYTYVYLDKFFPHLKPLFFNRPRKKSEEVLEKTEIDLKVSKNNPVPVIDELMAEVSEDEVLLAHLVKMQNYSTDELLDVAVSFVQSELYHAALKASLMAIENSTTDDQKLKGYYLQVTSLLKLGDYRAALDVSLQALTISKSQNDILSFMYSQAEAHLRLKEYKAAKSVLKKIISIDSSYRLAKERLERLNAI